MFTSEQRLQILKWGGLTLFSLSLLPLLMHGLFFIVLFQYYIPLAILAYAVYFSYLKIKQTDFSDDDIWKLYKSFFSKKK